MTTTELVAFAQRPPTSLEIERLRLILSTYQDGSGQLVEGTETLPGWRDFERAFALAFGGRPQEDKGFFDVLLPDPARPGIHFGCSCKMRGTLGQLKRNQRATLEISNAAGEFWLELGKKGITAANYRSDPQATGEVLLSVLESWRRSEGLENGGRVDLAGSYYYALQWSRRDRLYQLFQFEMSLPSARSLRWQSPSRVRENIEVAGRLVRATDQTDTILEWYGESGGQLKYYPPISTAVWASQPFTLEPLPKNVPHALLGKVAQYFPRAVKSGVLDRVLGETPR